MAKSNTAKEIGDIADKLQAMLDSPKEMKRPPNSITAKEYAESSGIRQGTAGDFLRRLHQEGRIHREKVGCVYYYTFKD
tara:strand:+ start:39 stop:275 length:237 start_codon:yes stop_codon:yes gene_type:complete